MTDQKLWKRPKAVNESTVIVVAGVSFMYGMSPSSVSSLSIIGYSVSQNDDFVIQVSHSEALLHCES